MRRSRRGFEINSLAELARLQGEEGPKVVDLSANVLPFSVMHFAYPISASRLTRSKFERCRGLKTKILKNSARTKVE